MIRINLLAERKARRTTSSSGEQSAMIGLVAILAAAGLVYLLVHRPKANAIEDKKKTNQTLTETNKAIKKKTADFDQRKAELEAAQRQQAAIEELEQSRVTPAWMLKELSTILTRGREPSITPGMQQLLEDNDNLQWQKAWDPKHLWIDEVGVKGGRLTIVGGAQNNNDVVQFAHRLQASMFFLGVQPQGAVQISARNSGISYYQFTINSGVRY